MTRNLVEYPITQEEAVAMLTSLKRVLSDGGEIGGLLPYFVAYCAGRIERMPPEEWRAFAAGLNP